MKKKEEKGEGLLSVVSCLEDFDLLGVNISFQTF